jgi:photosystem II stability/assembly factor-like uncharacterized protein
VGRPRIGRSWALFVAIAFLLAGCGGDVEPRSAAATSSTTTSTTVAPREVDEVQGLPLLSFANATTGWRINPVSYDAIERTTDGGRSWVRERVIPTTGTSLNGVQAIDSSAAIALVWSGRGDLTPTLWGTDDGQHFEPMVGHGLTGPVADVAFAGRADAWGVTRFGDVVTTNDAGTDWTKARPPQPGTPIEAVCLSAPRRGWAVSGTAVYRSDDDGATWRRQFVVPVGGGSPKLVCNGAHVAYASFDVGAGQHIGAFVRSDDGGGHWRPLTEDMGPNGPRRTAPGFPDNQERGDPVGMLPDGTLLFESGCDACGLGQSWLVRATDHFAVTKFDANNLQSFFVGASASDTQHLYLEMQSITADGAGPRPVTLYASDDGGQTWHVRWRGQ